MIIWKSFATTDNARQFESKSEDPKDGEFYNLYLDQTHSALCVNFRPNNKHRPSVESKICYCLSALYVKKE